MRPTGEDSKQCPICLNMFDRKHYENPKRWAERTFCSQSCQHEDKRKPILIGIIRPGGLSLEEIAIVADLDRTSVRITYLSAIAKFKKGIARYIGKQSCE